MENNQLNKKTLALQQEFFINIFTGINNSTYRVQNHEF
jgi:hypothetical protein